MVTALPTSTSQAVTTPRLFISLSSTQGLMPNCCCISTQQRTAIASSAYSSVTSSSATPSRASLSSASAGASLQSA